MFKNKQEYLEQRKNLMDKAQKFIDSGNPEEADKVIEEVKKLDESFETWKTAQANLNALKDNSTVEAVITNMASQDKTIMDSGEATLEDMTISSPEYKNAWIKAVKGGKLDKNEEKIINLVNGKYKNAETAAEHKLIIPTSVKDGIWEAATEQHPVLNDIEPTGIQGDVTIIKDTSKTSDADWIDENDESKDAEFSEGELKLTGCELSKSVTISWKLKKMNDRDYEAYLIRKLGRKVGNAIAKSLFTGKGRPGNEDSFKAQAKGVITAIEAEENTPRIVEFVDNIKYTDLTKLMSIIKSAYKAGAAIYSNNAFIWNYMANITDTMGRPLFVPDVTAGGVGRIFGIPVKEEDGVTGDMAVIGNFKEGYAFNFNEEMSIYTEDHVKARKTDYMAYGIADGDVITTECFAILKKKPIDIDANNITRGTEGEQHTYTREELEDMTINGINEWAEQLGYDISGSNKAALIDSFIAAQEG